MSDEPPRQAQAVGGGDDVMDREALSQIENFTFDNKGQIKALRKSSVIKSVEYVTQNIGGELVTTKLVPPRNLKVTNKLKKREADLDPPERAPR